MIFSAQLTSSSFGGLLYYNDTVEAVCSLAMEKDKNPFLANERYDILSEALLQAGLLSLGKGYLHNLFYE